MGPESERALQIESINPLVGEAWDSLVLENDHHSVFHRSAWAHVLTETYGHQPFYLKVSSADGTTLVPLMQVKSPLTGCRGVSLPFSDFAGLLTSGAVTDPAIYRHLTEFAKIRGWKHLDLRGGSVSPPNAEPFLSYQGHVLDLTPGLESLERALDPSVRRALRKANRAGLDIQVRRDPEAMRAFYELHGKTRRRHGLPPQPLKFFQNIATHLLGSGLGEVVLATLGGTPVAGAVFLRSAGRAIYKFGASETKHWELRPNQAVMWHAIRHLFGQGCRQLHFGRTSPADEGLSRFKRSWGCRAQILEYYRQDPRTASWLTASQPQTESHPILFGHLPLPLNRLAGRLIYPHLD